jgi:TPR repeat protein
LLPSFASGVGAGPFEDGMAALGRGDHKAAVKQFKKSASEGNVEALYRLTMVYLDGPATFRDRRRAAALLGRAAARNYADAQYVLGVLHFEGVGKKGNPRVAAAWFDQAAKQGHPQAAYNLAVLLDEGNGVKGTRRAVALYRQAAVGGVVEAEYTLGSMLAFGRNVARDPIEGGMWRELALEGGDEHVRDELNALRRDLTPAQLAEIRARVNEHRRRSARPPN